MFDEEPTPRKSIPLDKMSVEDLEALILDLKTRITEAENMIKKKRAATDAANAFFKS